jgi:hypothetical protein
MPIIARLGRPWRARVEVLASVLAGVGSSPSSSQFARTWSARYFPQPTSDTRSPFAILVHCAPPWASRRYILPHRGASTVCGHRQRNRIVERSIPAALSQERPVAVVSNHGAWAHRDRTGGFFPQPTPGDRGIPESRLRCALSGIRATRFQTLRAPPRNWSPCRAGVLVDGWPG